ncbi:M3 family oligoendopeptidase [Arcticibacterium luteifluviistationis]|uniref:M3 family oligoendopeptidase n=1 Tax=Arcticibacterium luteifluviistationis TaxID=1784714 RepID=A0A2Z4GEF6_9BACT|nr:M3 family oligoendopeptidase [Arcticibacterium luteifluviistationis]AWV99699.1 M3 family oligoendopeptidase [Arcticibacterium luteifluviistationis]
MQELVIPTRKPRKFLGEDFELNGWDSLKGFYEDLVSREIKSADELEKWFKDRDELESYLSENMAWRYIKMTCDTKNEEAQKNYQYFVTEVQPHLAVFDDKLNKKALENPFLKDLKGSGYKIALRSMKKSVEIFREANIPIVTEIQTKSTEYQAATGAMTVTIDDEEMTLQKAGSFLMGTNRAKREEAWFKIGERREEDRTKLDKLFDELKGLRQKVAENADFKNYRDYAFASLGRFDYTPKDCFDFHESVAEAVVPLLNAGQKERKAKLNLDAYRPWDKKVDVEGREGLKPFTNGEDLLDKTEVCFDKIDKTLGDYIRIMRKMGHFDVESRVGKAPGGYNYPLMEIGVPFIFMNATSTLRDVVTMVHEGGHAIHSFEVRELPLSMFKNTTSEVAEVASMAMELISMEHWDAFFETPEELKRAKIEHLEDILTVLPWIATVDKFQHWIYENPTHTAEERQAEWVKVFEEFSDTQTDWSGLEKFKEASWHRQLHIFELPFYYIEYGMAQLGAISVWRNYKKDPKKGLEAYLRGLKMGYTGTIGQIYEAMDIKFDFSKDTISELMGFVEAELVELKA